MAILKENLDVFLSDLAETATRSDGSIFPCHFDKFSDDLEFGAEGLRIVACTTSEKANGLSRGDTLVINGETYTIAQIQLTEDGKFTDLILSEA